MDAAYESAKTSKRCRRAATDHAANGKPHGLAPYGYRRTYDPLTGKTTGQEPDPDTAPHRRRHHHPRGGRRADRGRDPRPEIRQVPSPRGGRWTHATVRWACLNVTYIAKRKHNGGPLLDGDWPALVDEETSGRGGALTAGSRKVTRPGRAVWLL